MSKRARKLCSLCNSRPVGYGTNGDQQYAIDSGFCTPCSVESDHEINHDNGHETYAEGPEGECWYCRPELNEASKPYAKRDRATSNPSTRRAQLSHAGCFHGKTPKERRDCRNAFWATGSTDRVSFADFVNKVWLDAGYVVQDGMWVRPTAKVTRTRKR